MAARLATGQLAIAGMVAPVWFITLVIVQGLLQPDYSHVTMPISALAAWPAGWIQNGYMQNDGQRLSLEATRQCSGGSSRHSRTRFVQRRICRHDAE